MEAQPLSKGKLRAEEGEERIVVQAGRACLPSNGMLFRVNTFTILSGFKRHCMCRFSYDLHVFLGAEIYNLLRWTVRRALKTAY